MDKLIAKNNSFRSKKTSPSLVEVKSGLPKPETETNSDDFDEVQMSNSEEWEYAEEKACWEHYMPAICDYTHEPWKLRNETVLHKEQIRPDLAEPHKKLRISTSRGYFGSQRVFNCKVFPIFLFLFSSCCFLTLSCNAESLTWQWGQSPKTHAVPHCALWPTLFH